MKRLFLTCLLSALAFGGIFAPFFLRFEAENNGTNIKAAILTKESGCLFYILPPNKTSNSHKHFLPKQEE